MERLQRIFGAGGGLGHASPDSPTLDTSEQVYISSLALLKMLKHGRAGVPMEVMGLMLGEFVDEYTVRVVDVFAMPQSGTGVSVEAVDHVFQTNMLDMLKQTGRPEMVVGWYHSHPGFGCWLSGVDINTQQSFEALNQRAVAVVVDPIQSVKGKVVIDAFRSINPQTIMLGQEPRQTTSNLGHLNKPSIQALIHGLNRHYYSIAINYRKNELEEKMLLNLHKKKWTDGLTLRRFDTHSKTNEQTILQNNGSLYAHVFFARSGFPIDPSDPEYQPLNSFGRTHPVATYFPKRKVDKKKSLLGSPKDSDESKPEAEKVVDKNSEVKEEVTVEWVSLWKPNVTINLVDDFTQCTDLLVEPTSGNYYPTIYFNEFWLLRDKMIPINETVSEVPLNLEISPISMMKWQLFQQVDQSFQMQRSYGSMLDGESDELKRVFLEGNPYLLGITMCVSMLHSVFDFLAFKNDIQFWNKNKSMEGLSAKSVVLNFICQFVIFLYLLDNDTSWMILASSGVGVCIEFWKIGKAMRIEVDRSGMIPRLRFHDRESYASNKTKEYDDIAIKFLSYVLLLLVTLQNNGSLYAHVFFARSGFPIDPSDPEYQPLNSFGRTHPVATYFPKRKVDKKKSLLGSPKDSDESKPEVEKVVDKNSEGKEEVPVEWVSLWKPNVTINLVDDFTHYSQNGVPPNIAPQPSSGNYYPTIYFNEFWLLRDKMIPINETVSEVPLNLEISPISMMKWQLFQQVDQSFQMQRSYGSMLDGESDELKATLCNPYLLGITMCVSMLHSVFDFLAFKNDIQFWNKNKSMEGLSAKSVVLNFICQFVIFLYLLDNDTSWMILASSGVGVCIEFWKIGKAMRIEVDRSGMIPRLRFHDRESYASNKTKEYDDIAIKFLSYVLLLLVVSS
ncbi:hypothetical protein F2Q69_00039909 [Brassica cretica]|uniref:MPN domain-containing protein n=12 Tax=Magnoliopsida TaxID=3398 RepID=A0A8S9NV00_BRACR|nr:hypothetical protein F2Q69_00039909 [Brassica cretica]